MRMQSKFISFSRGLPKIFLLTQKIDNNFGNMIIRLEDRPLEGAWINC